MKSLTLGLVMLAAGIGVWPSSWFHNPRERTAEGLEAWDAGDFEGAAAAMDEALEAAGDDASPLLRYNAGTAQLATGSTDRATELLAPKGDGTEKLPTTIGPNLAVDTAYNLGNAHLAANDPTNAIRAYREALLADPSRRDAKHNLELALRQLQEQQEQEQEKEQQEKEKEQEPQQQQEQDGDEEQEPSPSDQDPSSPPQESPLPQFEPQQDMTPEQAAALLEAVENLEREQRREQAEAERKRQASQTAVERDW